MPVERASVTRRVAAPAAALFAIVADPAGHVANADRASFGYAWGWELTPVSDTETDVTNYFDWSGLSEERKAAAMLPLIPVTTIERSVENLERFATSD